MCQFTYEMSTHMDFGNLLLENVSDSCKINNKTDQSQCICDCFVTAFFSKWLRVI